MTEQEYKHLNKILSLCPKNVDYEHFFEFYEKYSNNFVARLKERYGIVLSLNDYFELIQNMKVEFFCSINKFNSFGKIIINNEDVFVLYNKEMKLLATAQPRSVMNNSREMIVATFIPKMREYAYKIHDIILEEIEGERFDFETQKEAALYYFKTCSFPGLLIDKYKSGTVKPLDVILLIKKILTLEHPLPNRLKHLNLQIKHETKKL